MAVIRSSDLDFDAIKENLKTYFQAQSEFADYNFEGSGLSNILDVLAYNTHINGLIANMGINESFLSSAQLRSSVVSHAETLGYEITSQSAATATVTLTVSTSDTTTTQISLPKYTTFTTTVDDITYTFMTLEAYIATNDGTGTFQFKTSEGLTAIPISQGTLKTKTFIVGDTADEQIYVIPDTTTDTKTLTVSVFDTTTSSSFTTYTDVQNVVRITPQSTVFIIREAPNGFYDLIFSSNNVLGQSPQAGNKIVVQYLSSVGALANSASVFTPDNQISFNSQTYDITVATVTNSSGGSEKESIESIKANAPLAFATQQRLVTAEDYKALILQRYSNVLSDVTAWSGSDNVPPIYGRTYVSLKFKDGISSTVQQATKDSIQTILSENLAVMSIDTVFADPITSFLEISVSFDFDPDQTGSTAQTTQDLVKTTAVNFVTNNLNKFDSVFRKSLLLTEIDGLSTAILNSSMDVKLQQRFIPTLNTVKDYTINFPVTIASPDDVNYRVESSRFTFSGSTSIFRNKLGTNKLEIVNIITGDVLVDNAGSYNASTGVVSLSGFNLTAFEGESVKVSIVPANENTIKPLRSYILSVDETLTSARATIDYQNTATTL